MNAATKELHESKASAAPKAVLLLIPGMLNGNDIWDGVIDALCMKAGDSVRVVIADVLTQSTIQDMARDAWKCLDGVAQGNPFYVAGFSMGGYVALEMLANQKHPIREAWLLSTSAEPESDASTPLREKAIASFESDFEKTIQNTARWGTFEKTPEQLQPVVESMRKLGAATAIRQTRAIMKRSDHRGQLRGLDIPVHIICGKEDRITPIALSQELAQTIPTAQLQMIERAGHMLPLEQPVLIAESMSARIVG